MKTNTPHRYLRRSRVKQLMQAGWLTTTESGRWWKHQRYPNIQFSTAEALTYQAAHAEKLAAESA